MPAPGRGVGAAAKALDGRAGENAFNTSAEPCRSFALVLPDRLEHGQHVIGFNLVDWYFTDDRISVAHKRLSPLVTVNLASQTLEPVGHIAFRHFLESGRTIPLRCRGDNCLRARMLDRINSLFHQSTRRAGLVSSFDKAHVGKRAEPHVARAAIQSKSVNPGPRAAWFNLQIEAGAVVMQAGRERADLCFGELLNRACHEKSPVGRTHVPRRPYASR